MTDYKIFGGCEFYSGNYKFEIENTTKKTIGVQVYKNGISNGTAGLNYSDTVGYCRQKGYLVKKDKNGILSFKHHDHECYSPVIIEFKLSDLEPTVYGEKILIKGNR